MLLTNLGGSEEDIERGLELGAVAYLVKSAYRPDEVISKVKEVLLGYTHGKDVPQAATTAAAERVLESTMPQTATPEKPEEKKEAASSDDQAPAAQ
jgi:DNA-binding response OmpR family regulator